jgi:hypothetical protein
MWARVESPGGRGADEGDTFVPRRGWRGASGSLYVLLLIGWESVIK